MCLRGATRFSYSLLLSFGSCPLSTQQCKHWMHFKVVVLQYLKGNPNSRKQIIGCPFFHMLGEVLLIPVSVSLDMLCRPCYIATLDVTALPAKKSKTTDPSNDRLLINRSIIAIGFCVG